MTRLPDVHVCSICQCVVNLQVSPIEGPPVYVSPPSADYAKPGQVLQLRASLYGLRSSGKSWYNTLLQYLLEAGLKPSRSDTCLFSNADRSLIIAVYVDDLLISAVDRQVADTFIVDMNRHKTNAAWKVKNMGRPSHFLGLEIRWNRFGVKLTHTKMIERLRARHSVSTAPVQAQCLRTPLSSHTTRPIQSLIHTSIGPLQAL